MATRRELAVGQHWMFHKNDGGNAWRGKVVRIIRIDFNGVEVEKIDADPDAYNEGVIDSSRLELLTHKLETVPTFTTREEADQWLSKKVI